VERELLGLPYISEAMVVGVEDEEFGQRVAAVVTLRDDQTTYSTTTRLAIDDLRSDLRKTLVGYKMPTLLRVLDGELPKGQTGKVLKKILGPELFPCPGWDQHPEIQTWSRDIARSKL
jgi:malonyl-CoA/methylmalonyl-CoA synthetase